MSEWFKFEIRVCEEWNRKDGDIVVNEFQMKLKLITKSWGMSLI